MNIFKTINQDIQQREYLNIEIRNIESSMTHWGNERGIRALAEKFDMASIDSNDAELENKLLNIFLDFSKENAKVEKVIFYKGFKYLVISNMRNFSPDNFFKRSIQMNHQKINKIIIINEITNKEFEEIQEGKKSLPDDWVENKDLTNKFETYRSLFLV